MRNESQPHPQKHGNAPFKKTFDGDGTAFGPANQAEEWLSDNGYSYGPSCAMHDQGILKGDFTIAKWRNLTKREIQQLDGKLIANRDGPATIILYRNQPDGHA